MSTDDDFSSNCANSSSTLVAKILTFAHKHAGIDGCEIWSDTCLFPCLNGECLGYVMKSSMSCAICETRACEICGDALVSTVSRLLYHRCYLPKMIKSECARCRNEPVYGSKAKYFCGVCVEWIDRNTKEIIRENGHEARSKIVSFACACLQQVDVLEHRQTRCLNETLELKSEMKRYVHEYVSGSISSPACAHVPIDAHSDIPIEFPTDVNIKVPIDVNASGLSIEKLSQNFVRGASVNARDAVETSSIASRKNNELNVVSKIDEKDENADRVQQLFETNSSGSYAPSEQSWSSIVRSSVPSLNSDKSTQQRVRPIISPFNAYYREENNTRVCQRPTLPINIPSRSNLVGNDDIDANDHIAMETLVTKTEPPHVPSVCNSIDIVASVEQSVVPERPQRVSLKRGLTCCVNNNTDDDADDDDDRRRSMKKHSLGDRNSSSRDHKFLPVKRTR